MSWMYVLDSFNCSTGFLPWSKVNVAGLKSTNLLCNEGREL